MIPSSAATVVSVLRDVPAQVLRDHGVTVHVVADLSCARALSRAKVCLSISYSQSAPEPTVT
jgi:hypothetical protein